MDTLELIDSLKKEMQQYNEKLAEIFPERVLMLSNAKLSIIWNMNVNRLKTRIRKGSPITHNSIKKLVKGLKFHLRKNVVRCYKLIRELENNEISTLTFIREIKKEVAKYSNLIEMEDNEFSILFFGTENYLKYLKQKIKNPNHPQYNPDYKLSLAQLIYFKNVIYQKIDKNPAQIIDLINYYIEQNPNLREYSYQQFTITNPHIFDEIDSVNKAYWLGFLCADGSLSIDSSNKYEISLELSSKDRIELIKFAKFVGFNSSKIRDRYRILKNKDGCISIFKMSCVRFLCKPMGQALLRNGKFGSNSEDLSKRVPLKIKDFLKSAKTVNNNLSNTLKGRIGLAQLLGYFDGDGTIHRDRKGKRFSGEIISSSKALLKDIKETYDIEYPVGFKDEKQDTYRLSLGTKLYKTIMSIYPDSMKRKRPN